MKKMLIVAILGPGLFLSCVSKKKYVALEEQLSNTQSTLQKTAVEKQELEERFARIEARVAEYNAKISSLQETNDAKYELNDIALMNQKTKENMRNTLAQVDPALLEGATTLEDSINVAVSYNLPKSITVAENSE